MPYPHPARGRLLRCGRRSGRPRCANPGAMRPADHWGRRTRSDETAEVAQVLRPDSPMCTVLRPAVGRTIHLQRSVVGTSASEIQDACTSNVGHVPGVPRPGEGERPNAHRHDPHHQWHVCAFVHVSAAATAPRLATTETETLLVSLSLMSLGAGSKCGTEWRSQSSWTSTVHAVVPIRVIACPDGHPKWQGREFRFFVSLTTGGLSNGLARLNTSPEGIPALMPGTTICRVDQENTVLFVQQQQFDGNSRYARNPCPLRLFCFSFLESGPQISLHWSTLMGKGVVSPQITFTSGGPPRVRRSHRSSANQYPGMDLL